MNTKSLPQHTRTFLSFLLFVLFNGFLNAQSWRDHLQREDTTFFLIQARMEAYFAYEDSLAAASTSTAAVGDEEEDGERVHYRRWEYEVQSLIDASGKTDAFYNAYKTEVDKIDLCGNSTLDDDIDWKSFGPDRDYGAQDIGRISGLSVNPDNHNDIIAATGASGIWRTLDGGAHWTNTTDDEFVHIGVPEQAYKNMFRLPGNPNTIYVATANSGAGVHVTGGDNGNASGIIVSSDGGNSWSVLPGFVKYKEQQINNLYFAGTGTLFGEPSVILIYNTEKDIYRYETNGLIYTEKHIANIWDLNAQDAYPAPEHMPDRFPSDYVLWWQGVDEGIEAMFYDDKHPTSTKVYAVFRMQVGRDLDSDPATHESFIWCHWLAEIDFYATPTIIYHDLIGIAQDKFPTLTANINDENNDKSSFMFNDDGDINVITAGSSTLIFKRNVDESEFTCINYGNNSISSSWWVYASPHNENVMYARGGRSASSTCNSLGVANLCKSINGGQNFIKINHSDCADMHVDNHAFEIYQYNMDGTDEDGSEDVFVLGNDGGITKSIANDIVDGQFGEFDNINGIGLDIGQYYGVGVTEQNAAFLMAGAQDGSYDTRLGNGTWLRQRGGDKGKFLINPNNIDEYLYSINGQIIKIGSSSFFHGGFTTGLEGAFIVLPFALDINNEDRIYYTGNGISTKVNGSFTEKVIFPNNAGDDIERFTSIIGATTSSSIKVYFSTDKMITSLPSQRGIYKAVSLDGGATWSATNINNNLAAASDANAPLFHGQINDIAVDPDNPDRLWCVFSGINPGGAHKVYYSSNAGASWTDVSGCLPNMPVYSIVYQKYTNDRLYIGTQFGVYFSDNPTSEGAQWYRYGNKQVSALPYDLEINYCGKYLVAATYGRGVRYAELPHILGELVIGEPNPASGGTITVWSTDKNFDTDIRIISGNRLKIQDGATIHMAIGKKIIVEPGARLDVSNATITNGCSTWDGIEVQGHSSDNHPDPSSIIDMSYPALSSVINLNPENQQGVVYLNNATIENAKNAIRNTKEFSYGYDPAYNGGVIVAMNTLFHNNCRSIEFLKYTKPNSCLVKNCHFLTDMNHYDMEGNNLTNGAADVTLWETSNIKFTQNTFEDARDNEDVERMQDRRRGIYSENASYSVVGEKSFGQYEACKIEGNKFIKLYRGIEALGFTGLIPKVVVNQNKFAKCLRGVSYRAMNNSFFMGNLVDLEERGFTVYPGMGSHGFYQEGGSNNVIYENQIYNNFLASSGYPATPVSQAIYMNNSGLRGQRLYRNHVEAAKLGVVALNNNLNLQIKCNDFANIQMPQIAVAGGPLGNQGRLVVAGYPGYNSAPAGNRFDAVCGTAWNEQIYVAADQPSFRYVHHADLPLDAACYTAGKVIPVPSTATYSGNESASCPDDETVHLVSCGGEYSPVTQFWVGPASGPHKQRLTQADNSLNQLANQFDGGNTAQYISNLNNPANTGQSLVTICYQSPMLSDAALLSFLKRRNDLTDQQIYDVALHTAPHSPEAQIALSNCLLPAYMYDSLNSLQANNTNRAQTLQQLHEALVNKDICVGKLIDYYLYNEIYDTLQQFLDNRGEEYCKAALVDLKSDLNQLSGIQNLMALYGNDANSNLGQYKILQGIRVDLLQQNKDWAAADAAQISQLEAVAQSNVAAAFNARNILRHISGQYVDEEYISNSSLSQRRMQAKEYNFNQMPLGYAVYPNPANNILYVERPDLAPGAVVEFSLIDGNGKEVLKQTLQDRVQLLQIENLTQGIYLVKFAYNGKVIKTDKVVIAR